MRRNLTEKQRDSRLWNQLKFLRDLRKITSADDANQLFTWRQGVGRWTWGRRFKFLGWAEMPSHRKMHSRIIRRALRKVRRGSRDAGLTPEEFLRRKIKKEKQRCLDLFLSNCRNETLAARVGHAVLAVSVRHVGRLYDRRNNRVLESGAAVTARWRKRKSRRYVCVVEGIIAVSWDSVTVEDLHAIPKSGAVISVPRNSLMSTKHSSGLGLVELIDVAIKQAEDKKARLGGRFRSAARLGNLRELRSQVLEIPAGPTRTDDNLLSEAAAPGDLVSFVKGAGPEGLFLVTAATAPRGRSQEVRLIVDGTSVMMSTKYVDVVSRAKCAQ